jgi:hypothetical protein
VNLASALAAALAAGGGGAGLVDRGRAHHPQSRADGRGHRRGAGLAFGFGPALWDQAVRAEVYAVEAALVCLALAWLLERRVLAAAFAVGLALANHHFVTLLFALPAVLYVLSARPRAVAVARATALVFLGLAAWLYLPLRARARRHRLGRSRSLAAVSGGPSRRRAFQKSLAEAARGHRRPRRRPGDRDHRRPRHRRRACSRSSAPMPWRARGRPGADLGLCAGVAALGVTGRALLGFEHDNPDAHGYLLPALAAAGVLARAAPPLVARAVPRAAPLVAALAFVWPASLFVHSAAEVTQRRAYAAEDHGRLLLALPPRTLVVTSYFETTFQLLALQHVFGERPDISVIDRGLLTHPFAIDAARRIHPDLDWLLATLAGGKLPAASDRPIAVELAPNLRPDPRLVPLGGLARLAAAPPAPAQRALAEREDARRAALEDASAATTPAPRDQHGAHRALAWQSFLTARLYCSLARRDAAQRSLSRARKHVATRDEMVEDLAAACGLPL